MRNAKTAKVKPHCSWAIIGQATRFKESEKPLVIIAKYKQRDRERDNCISTALSLSVYFVAQPIHLRQWRGYYTKHCVGLGRCLGLQIVSEGRSSTRLALMRACWALSIKRESESCLSRRGGGRSRKNKLALPSALLSLSLSLFCIFLASRVHDQIKISQHLATNCKCLSGQTICITIQCR